MAYLPFCLCLRSYLFIIAILTLCYKCHSELFLDSAYVSPIMSSTDGKSTVNSAIGGETPVVRTNVKSNDFVYSELKKSVSIYSDKVVPSYVFLPATGETADQKGCLSPLVGSEIHEECKLLLYNFTSLASNYTMCVIENTVNGSICRNCQSLYISLVNRYSEILRGPSHYKCKDELLKQNNMAVLQATHHVIITSWSNGSCDNCFENENGSSIRNLTKEALKFFTLLKAFYDCLSNHSQVLDNTITCKDCRKSFEELSSSFVPFLENPSGICKDLVDNMKSAHLCWVNTLKCISFSYKGYPTFILSGIITLLPFVLYSAAKFSLSAKDVTIMHSSRLTSTHSSYANMWTRG